MSEAFNIIDLIDEHADDNMAPGSSHHVSEPEFTERTSLAVKHFKFAKTRLSTA